MSSLVMKKRKKKTARNLHKYTLLQSNDLLGQCLCKSITDITESHFLQKARLLFYLM